MPTATSSPPASDTPTVLVTDPEQRAALAAVRALHRAGYRVVTLGESKGLAGVSRAVAKAHLCQPQSLADAGRYVEAIREVVTSEQVRVLLPITDRASRILLGSELELSCAIAGPSAAAYAAASDKEHLLSMAESRGIRVPRQITLVSPDASHELESLAEHAPAVIKPTRSVVLVNGQTVSTKVRYASNRADIHRGLRYYPAEAYPLLIQERIIGEGVGAFLLRSRGHTVLSFGHRRLREKPPAGGVSTYRESWEPPVSLIQRCETLLDALGYDGAAMIEFKQEVATGELVLMEINARLWGSVQLAVDAGVDFPTALVRMAQGLPIAQGGAARQGVRSVWEMGELDHALALVSRSAGALDLPPGTPTGWRAAWTALRDHRQGDYPEVFRFADPLPFVAELWRWFQRR